MSDWYQIESNQIVVQIFSKGAEMKRLFNKAWNRELLWPGSEKNWNRSSPILFPIVGSLIDDQFIFEDQLYSLKQHGFARDHEFFCSYCSNDEIEFFLVASSETYKIYPFIFELKIRYKIIETKVIITSTVTNLDKKTLYFSIGAHPGFELDEKLKYEINFEKKEESYSYLNNKSYDPSNYENFRNDKLEVNKNLFDNDALIFTAPNSKYVELLETRTKRCIRVSFEKCSYLGIWGNPDLNFICLEPWHGVSDIVGHDKEIKNKLGILHLEPNEFFNFNYSIDLYLKN